MKQVRKIKPTRRSISGHVTFKDSNVPFESSLERDFLTYYTFTEDVLDIVSQPISIPFKKNGRNYTYTPDFFIQIKSRSGPSLLVEVKPKEEWQANWRDWSDKWKAAIKFCKEQGFRFTIYDEDRIRHFALDNINFLMRYRNLAVNEQEVNALLQDIELRGNTNVEYLLERYFKGSIYRKQGHRLIWHLMAHRRIGFDIWNDVHSEKTEVWYDRKY